MKERKEVTDAFIRYFIYVENVLGFFIMFAGRIGKQGSLLYLSPP